MDEQTRQLAEAREREAAMREILRVISQSRDDYGPVFRTILDNAIRLCGAPFGCLLLIRGEHMHVVANAGLGPELLEFFQANPHPVNHPSSLLGQAARDRTARQRVNLANDDGLHENPRRNAALELGGIRTLLGVPIIQNNETVGVIALWRQEVEPFSDDDIALVTTFADQATIAIENVRQFQMVQARTADLTQSLEHQTATSEILRSISRSPTDYGPVFDTILRNATRLCDAPFGTLFLLRDGALHVVADAGSEPAMVEHLRNHPMPLDETSSVLIRAVIAREPLQQDLMDEAYHAGDPRRLVAVDRFGCRTWLGVPLLKTGEVIGAIALYRKVAEPFADDDIELVRTFADQAVIAIENVRQFQTVQARTADLTKSLERQTATSEILRSISQSPTDYDPVFDTILENATRLCGAPLGILYLLRDGHLQLVADAGPHPEVIERLRANPRSIDDPFALSSRTAKTQETTQIADLIGEAQRVGDPARLAVLELGGVRTVVGVPMLKGKETVGVISLYRQEVNPFADEDVELVRTFADQAVIAIENVRLFQALESRNSALGESLERQTATSDILRAISRSPTDYQPVFEAILESAARLCDAPLARLYLLRDGLLHPVADHGEGRPEFIEFMRDNPRPADQGTGPMRRALTQCKSINVEDIRTEALFRDGEKFHIAAAELGGVRTFLVVPLVKGENGIGVIVLYRREVRAFEDRHVGLVETFADQAVIAIENVRLFQALEGRTADLTKTLERQTATSEILRSISQSPTDYTPVFNTILKNAFRLCGARFGVLHLLRDEHLHLVADIGAKPEYVEQMRAYPLALNNPFAATSRAARERIPAQLADVRDEAQRSGDSVLMRSAEVGGIRTVCAVPMLKGNETVGVLALYREEVKEFEADDIELVSTFADQAVIAIENVRLFQALESRNSALGESLERQTATSEILRSISRSPTDYQPVFDTILENATRLCDAPLGQLYLIRDGGIHLVANRGSRPEFLEFSRDNVRPVNRTSGSIAKALSEGRPVYAEDATRESLYGEGDKWRVAGVELEGIRSVMTVPLLKGEDGIGVILLYRREVRQFEERHVSLLETFASQAVIAIENVRLFQALEGRTSDLTKSLERQTATSEILRSISQSPTGYDPVFDTILENASRLCDVQFSGLFLLRDDHLHLEASLGGDKEFADFYRANPVPLDTPDDVSVAARCARERTIQHDIDVRDSDSYRSGDKLRVAAVDLGGIRTLLMVPLFRDEQTLGVLALFRQEVRAFGDDEIELVRTFADQAVIAIENVNLFNETREALERQTASADILKAISDSPTDVQPVFDTITRNAIKLCDGVMSAVWRFDGEQIQFAAQHGWTPEALETFQRAYPRTPAEDKVIGRALLERRVINIADVRTEFRTVIGQVEMAHRSVLVVPLLREGVAIGAITVARKVPGLFLDKQIDLVTTFADQAVIAIENVRLFQALEGRTADLTKTLERQTATSEILRSISQSPTDYQPVFDTILENAAKLCGTPFGGLFLLRDDHLHVVAHTGWRPERVEYRLANPISVTDSRSIVLGAAAAKQMPQQSVDFSAAAHSALNAEAVEIAERENVRTLLGVPMLKGGETVGVIGLYREEVKAFDDEDIALVSTFADQAVIAIENVRLFNETNESLERQTATADILKVISSSPTDVQPVFDAIARSAQKLCDATISCVFRFDGKQIQFVAHHGWTPEGLEVYRQAYPLTPAEDKLLGRVLLESEVVNVADIVAQFRAPIGQAEHGHRSCLAVPILREGVAIGAIVVGRKTLGLFLDRQIELLKTFADQAVIAIENVSLFQTLEARTTELTKTLERQTATSEILRSISQSPTDYTPVFQAILDNAIRLCSAPFGMLFLLRDDQLHVVADAGSRPEYVEHLRNNPRSLTDNPQGALMRAALDGVACQVEDLMGENHETADRKRVEAVEIGGIRTLLTVPMRKGDVTLGVIVLYRQEVKRFDDDDIELVTTFADQAVIAIENVRMFQALEGRTTELTKTLERQTATSEILRSISRSPTDYAPVFDIILENATRLCGAPFGILFLLRGDYLHAVADVGGRPEFLEYLHANPAPLNDSVLLTSRAAKEGVPAQLADLMVEAHRSGSPTRIATVEIGGIRTMLCVPMLKDKETVGVITLYRREVETFADDDIELVTTFADQAVIAIENVRLFQALEGRTADLTKTLERQTATSEILRSISRSPTDYAPVFDTILENATRLCEAPLGNLFLFVEGQLRSVASRGARPAFIEFLAHVSVPVDEHTTVGQAALHGRAFQTEDAKAAMQAEAGTASAERVAAVQQEGTRTFVAVPMLRDKQVVGVIAVYRREVRLFNDAHIELLETFADQAVIAIENVRLFQTAESRSSELAQSVAELEALGDIAQAVSSSLDVDTVLDTIVTRAVQLSRADAGAINEFDEATDTLPFRAAPGMEHMIEQPAPRLGEGAVGRAAATRAPVQIADITVPGAYTGHLTDSLSDLRIRALLAVPMMQNDDVLGTLVVARRTPGEFPPEAERLLRALGTQSAIAIRNARLFREIEDKSRELEAANRHKSEFLANMSHELRTPLNAIIGFSEVLGERMFGDLNDKQAEYVTDIHDSGRHLLSLINDILDLSKVEAGAMELDLGRFALAPALDNALTLVRERAERRGIVLQAQLADDLGEMEGDERKLKQILLNLLSNAIKFTGEGGSVTLEARQDGTHVHIAVRDTGVGISEEDLAVIFEEFKQVGTDYARKVEGTGLGLTLTKRFIEMHGGHITVTSEPGEGSVFTVVLPLRAVEQAT